MVENREGFFYPVVDAGSCTDCKLCERVCPVLHPYRRKEPSVVFAAKNKNQELRLSSSSGGLFSLAAEKVINDGGVVFGACFNAKMEIEHRFTETLGELRIFRGSKYVQGNTADCYRQAARFLEAGRKVLFSGTPCQIAGLKQYLQHDYEELITIEVVCHGVPSPKVWRNYYSGIGLQCDSACVTFRDKQNGWRHYNFTVTDQASGKVLYSEPAHRNFFMKGFLQNLYLRPSCHHCMSKAFKSGADIVLGDFWGIGNYYPEFDDDKGVSLVIPLSTKGTGLFKTLSVDCIETDYRKAFAGNPCLELSSPAHPKREKFFVELNKNKKNVVVLISRCLRPPFRNRLKRLILNIIRKK